MRSTWSSWSVCSSSFAFLIPGTSHFVPPSTSAVASRFSATSFIFWADKIEVFLTKFNKTDTPEPPPVVRSTTDGRHSAILRHNIKRILLHFISFSINNNNSTFSFSTLRCRQSMGNSVRRTFHEMNCSRGCSKAAPYRCKYQTHRSKELFIGWHN